MIYIRWTVSHSPISISAILVYPSPARAYCSRNPKKLDIRFVRITLPSYAGILPYYLSRCLSGFFHIHPFRLSALTFPHHIVPRMFFVPLPLSHCHRSPLSSSMPRLSLPVSCQPVFHPSPSNLVVFFAHDILSIHGPSPYSLPLDGRTGRCDHMWTVRPVLFLALPPMPSRYHFPPPPLSCTC